RGLDGTHAPHETPLVALPAPAVVSAARGFPNARAGGIGRKERVNFIALTVADRLGASVMTRYSLWLVAALWLCLGAKAGAEQFVLFDVTFTYTKEDADNSKPSKSHFYVKGDRLNPKRPKDWTGPVDYRNGTVHIRAEVIEKPPGGEPTTWSICYIPNRGQGNGYGCTGTDLYREKGVYEKDVPMKSFWENDAIVWSEGIKQMDLVMKDGSGGNG